LADLGAKINDTAIGADEMAVIELTRTKYRLTEQQTMPQM